MKTYTGLHARLYDVVYADKPYRDEAQFVDTLLRNAGVSGGRLLDVACGTGRHASKFDELGWEVTGVDISEELLEHARRNVPDARFVQQDMRRLELAGERFAAITCLFDSIGYAVDDKDIVATLKAFRRHLEANGAVVLEFLHAPTLLREASPLRVRTFTLPGGDELLRISRTRLDERRSVMEVDFELLELHADGRYIRWSESHTNRFLSLDEMEAFLRDSDLQLDRFVPAYSDGEIDDETFHVLALAKTGQ